jgi:hypothetical protein
VLLGPRLPATPGPVMALQLGAGGGLGSFGHSPLSRNRRRGIIAGYLEPPMLFAPLVPVAVAALLSPAATTHAMAADGQSYRAHWSLDEVGSSTALDSSGNGNVGTNYNIVGDGAGYTFNGVDSRVIVPTAAILNPVAADFSWGVTLTMTQPPSPVGETYDVLRKGLVTTKGGDYKFEVKNVNGKALARCVAKTVRKDGTKVLAAIQGTTTLADSHPHVVTCTKTSTSITLKVDSLTPRTKTFAGGLGSVSNTSNLALGAKAESTASTGFDWFKGVISDAWVA